MYLALATQARCAQRPASPILAPAVRNEPGGRVQPTLRRHSSESTQATTSCPRHENLSGNCFANAAVSVFAMRETCCRIIGQVSSRRAYSFFLYWLIGRTWCATCAAIRPRTVSFDR